MKDKTVLKLKVQAAHQPPYICLSSFAILQHSPNMSPSRPAPIPTITRHRSDPAPTFNFSYPG